VRGDGILDDSASGRKPLGMGREAIILSHYSKVMLLLTLKWPPIKPLYLKSAARRQGLGNASARIHTRTHARTVGRTNRKHNAFGAICGMIRGMTTGRNIMQSVEPRPSARDITLSAFACSRFGCLSSKSLY